MDEKVEPSFEIIRMQSERSCNHIKFKLRPQTRNIYNWQVQSERIISFVFSRVIPLKSKGQDTRRASGGIRTMYIVGSAPLPREKQ